MSLGLSREEMPHEDREPQKPAPESDVATPQAASLLALQRGAGNQAVGRMIQRAKTTPRQTHEKQRLWTERLQGAGVPGPTATALATAFADSGVSIVTVEAFGVGLGATWQAPNLVGLIRRFTGAAGGRSAADWMTVAGPLVDREVDVALFARLNGGWGAAGVGGLAALFAANAGGRAAASWVAIAAQMPNQAADVAAFARLAGWTTANAATLGGLFVAAAGGRTSADWATIAPTLANQPALAAQLARGPAAWTPANLALLGGLFAANPGARTLADWLLIAAQLANQPAQVSDFARLAGWNTANATTLAGLFAAGAGGRTSAEWAQMAVAHANFVDQENDVAALARLDNWPAATLAGLANAGWINADIVACLGHVIGAGANRVAFRALLATAGFPAAGAALIAVGWTSVQLGQFLAGALSSQVGAAAFQGLLGIAGFPAAAVAMIGAGWPHQDLGSFLGNLIVRNVPAAAVQALIVAPGLAASSRLMIAAPWALVEYARFVAGALLAGLTPANLSAAQATAGFPAASLALFTGGMTATRVGEFLAAALAATITTANLVAFLNTAGAVPATVALVPAWGANGLGQTIGHVRTRVGAPTDPEMVVLLQDALTHVWQAVSVRNAANGVNCGPPNWTRIQGPARTFSTAWVGGGSGGPGSPATVFNGALHGGGYQVSLSMSAARQSHVEQGHTYEYFLFTYANCMRNNNGGNVSIYAVGTDVSARLAPLSANGVIQGMADRAVWGPIGNAGFVQQDVAQHRVGVIQSVAPVGGIFQAEITQYYPRAAAAALTMPGADYVAIGRLLGLITP